MICGIIGSSPPQVPGSPHTSCVLCGAYAGVRETFATAGSVSPWKDHAMRLLEKRGPRRDALGPALTTLSTLILLSGDRTTGEIRAASALLIISAVLLAFLLWPGPRRPPRE